MSNSAFEAELRKWLDEELVRLRMNLETPGTVKAYDDYRYLVGRIYAVVSVAEQLDDINKLINSR